MSFISSIGLAVPANKFAQAQISAFMERLAPTEEIRKTIHTVFRASGIRTRYSVLSDYGKESAFDFFPNTEGLDPFPGTSLRMKEFRKHAVGLSLDAVRNCLATSTVRPSDITHLITVSCTGMYAPGLDLDLVNLLSFKTSINRTCINFMGCFAAISAIKTADSFCAADPTAKVLIVCTELCSLHFQKEFTDDTILSNALFGDGSAAVLVEAKPTAQALLQIESSHSEILQNGSEHMAWTIGDLGFEMKLSSYVADVLSHEVGSLVNNLYKKASATPDSVKHFAIHPGGKKILDSVAARLGLEKEKLGPSYQTLRDYGNMSSPTVLFVLKKIMEGNVSEGERVMAMAFGPGLTVESLLLKIV